MVTPFYEDSLRSQGMSVIAGVDEVGRGPLAGPVMAAAVVVPHDSRVRSYLCSQAADSKRLTAPRRMALAEFIREHCVVGIGSAGVDEIDALNIRNATFVAMRRALVASGMLAEWGVIVDGNASIPDLPVCRQVTVIGGDAVELAVACASIVAKVARDALMTDLALLFPHYGWEKNAGYGTPSHLRALREFGPCVHHRTSFSPVKELCDAAA